MRAAEIVTGMETEITMYLVSNPTRLSPHPLASPAGSLSSAEGGAGGRQDGRPQSYFRLKANIHGDLEFHHQTVWTLGPLCQMRFPEKRSVAYLEAISLKSSRHFCAQDLFIGEEYIIVLNYGL